MIYMDNAATTMQKPKEVGEAICQALFTIGNTEFVIAVYRIFKTFKGVYCLTESFDYRYAAYIFNCFIVHIAKSVLVVFHILCHFRPRHFEHSRKAENNWHKTYQAKAPVK